MKMQCKTDGSGGHCARCRNANLFCKHSEPGRPGRTVTRSGNVIDPNSAAAVDLTVSAISTPTLSRTTADEGTWSQSTLTEYGAVERSVYLREDHIGTCTKDGFLDSFPGSPYLPLDTTESLGPSDWLWNISEAEVRPKSTIGDNQQVHQGAPGEMGVAADPNLPSATSRTNTTLPVDRNYMEILQYATIADQEIES
ncbi:uncharacterized protein BCR38DRAFT_489377 [Pseudomassariella vexata]|uniref:Zn(2)-C6 fungal-type domain-containing protein n=1 Tax=Pseudomassariella vexata TaxID=1141098 RepID=A0A1Y2DGS1_9PEZI|nr:uncharacterized protein BCR38DRAFT_489377 [Pseudomassariella vexata]ORY58458.1 hypothetical protein BCR38DRAFT_489377 [Pseudomassariella vexata]